MNTTIISNSLGRNNRLKSRKSIARLFSNGQVINVPPIRVLYGFSVELPGLKAAFSASSRNFRRAVDRNRLKRLMREAYRVRKAELELKLAGQQRGMELFFIYTGKELAEMEQVAASMEVAIARLLKTLK